MNEETLVYFGGEVKSLGGGKVGGQLITFGNAKSTDLEGDFFDESTDFDVDFSTEVKSTVYYNHGTDPVLGRKKLGNGIKATLSRNDIGIWVEAQLDDRNEYEKAILTLVDQKKMGWSSGTASYLVEREQVGKSYHIKKWTLGVDASLTPTPAEHKNVAVALKSLKTKSLKAFFDGEEDSMIGDDVFESAAFSSLCDLQNSFLYMGLWNVIFSDLIPSADKSAKIKAGFQELADAGSKIAEALLSLSTDEQQAQYQVAKSLYFEEPAKQKFASLKEHIQFVNKEVKNLGERLSLITEAAGSVKKGAQFNAKNKEYLMSLADDLSGKSDELDAHAKCIKDMVSVQAENDNAEADSGKSINTDDMELALHAHELFKLNQQRLNG